MARNGFDLNDLTAYEKRVIAQLTDEASRLKDFERIFPPPAG